MDSINKFGNIIKNTFTGGVDAGKVDKGKIFKNEPSITPRGDQVSLSSTGSLPSKKVIKESTDDYIQNQGVIKSSKAFIEETVLDTSNIKPGQVKSGEIKDQNKVVKKEVTFKSGVTISEDTKEHKVTVSRNDGNGLPKTLAVFDGASLTLPTSDSKPLGLYERYQKTHQDNVEKPGRDEVVIRGKDMDQAINKNGTITLYDKVHGAAESPETPILGGISGYIATPALGFVGIGNSLLSKWHSDKYTITPDDQVSGKQFKSKSVPSGLTGYMPLSVKTEVKEVDVDAKLHKDGTVEAQRSNNTGGLLELRYEGNKTETVLLKPFVQGHMINTPSQPAKKGAVERAFMGETSPSELAGPMSGGEIQGPNKKEGKFDLNELVEKSIERNTNPKTGEINSRAVFMELFD